MSVKSSTVNSEAIASTDKPERVYPRLTISLSRLEDNARLISRLGGVQGITVTGITKACCGDPEIARAMLRGGVTSLGDSRVENLRRLRNSGITGELLLIRTPMLSEVEDVVRLADISLNSELSVLIKLSQAAIRLGKRHRIILMVEMGDLREGLCCDDLMEVVAESQRFRGVDLCGLGMNLACLGGVIPTPEKIEEFSCLVNEVEEALEIQFKIVSGGNSANIPLLLGKRDESHRVNHLRIGEGILLGCDSVMRRPIPGACQDAFVLECEIIELNDKPSLPNGEVAEDAYGRRPSFQDLGTISRGLLAIGRQDVLVEGLTSVDPSVSILGASSDHIAVRFQTSAYRVGDIVKFRVSYGALAQLFMSPFVRKVMI